MATRPEIVLDRTFVNLGAGLTDGDEYVCQHVGGQNIEYCDSPTDPTDLTIGKMRLRPYEWMRFEVDASEPTWARSRSTIGKARLVLNKIDD